MARLPSNGGYWTEKKERAVVLIFEGQKHRTHIAAELGISPSTLRDWLADAEFQARLQTMRANLAEELEGIAFVNKEQRIIALSKLAEQAREEWETHRKLVEQRPVPGGMLITERLNEGAANILRGALDDLAKELGARATNVKLAGKVEKQQTILINVVDVPEELRRQYMLTNESAASDEAAVLEVGNARMIVGPSNQADDDDDDDDDDDF